MAEMPVPVRGACRCGKVRLTVSAPAMMTMACHCTGCQRMTGSAYSLTVAVPGDALTVEGDTVIGGLHGDQSRHHHCDYCKSWLFTRIEPDIGFVNIRATMLDGAADWFAPFIETWTSEALPWARTAARHSYPAFPAAEGFAPLMAEFASERGSLSADGR